MKYSHFFLLVLILVISACGGAESTSTATEPVKNQEFVVNLVEVDDIDPSDKVMPALQVSVEGFQNGSEVKITPFQGSEIEFTWNGVAPAYIEYAGMMDDYARINTAVVVNHVVYKVDVEKIGTKVVKLYLTPNPQK